MQFDSKSDTRIYHNKIVAIIQARMGSKRLPGKMMMDLCGYPVLHWVIARCKKASILDEVVLATTTKTEDDCLVRLAKQLKINTFRGSEENVLERFLKAAERHNAKVVVRVCADNPLIAPEEINRIVMHHLRTNADYSFNHVPALDNLYPDGLGAEVVNKDVLVTISRLSIKKAHREHVTAYIWDHLSDFRVATLAAPPSIAGPEIKLDIDTEKDLARIKMVLGPSPCDVLAWDAEQIVVKYRQML